MTEQEQRPEEVKRSEEEITDAIRRLRVYQMGELRVIGMMPKVPNLEHEYLENAVRLDIDVLGRRQNGTFVKAPSMASIDYCMLPVRKFRIENPGGGYLVSELDEHSARATALIYLDFCDGLKELLEDPDEVMQASAPQRQIMPAGPGAMQELDRIAKGRPPGPGGIITP